MVLIGRQILRNQKQLSQLDWNEHLPIPSRPLPLIDDGKVEVEQTSAQCAAVGQSSLMALYDSMFKVYGMGCGQVSSNTFHFSTPSTLTVNP